MFRVALTATLLTSALSLSCSSATAQLPQPNGGIIERGLLPVHWLSQEPDLRQSHRAGQPPYLDYPVGTMCQPNEHELALSRGALLELEDAMLSMHNTPGRLALRDLSVLAGRSKLLEPSGKSAIQNPRKGRERQNVEPPPQ